MACNLDQSLVIVGNDLTTGISFCFHVCIMAGWQKSSDQRDLRYLSGGGFRRILHFAAVQNLSKNR
jgi:hypothetical protein